MRRLIYDVATSVDGFIAGPDDAVGGFLYEGDHVDAYRARLQNYATVVMGRRTYEVGYAFGMKPGDEPYPPMDHHVFSRTLQLPGDSQVRVVREDWLESIDALKDGQGGDIYLCGGGSFAGLLLAAGRIDRLVLKVNPLLLGGGIRLFGDTTPRLSLQACAVTTYASGVRLLEYELQAPVSAP